MDKNFGNIAWTNHAIERMRQRGISQSDAWATWNRPEQSYKGSLHRGNPAWRYYRTFGDQRIEVVAVQDERKRWVVLSVWSKKVSPQDRGANYSTKSFFGDLGKVVGMIFKKKKV